MLVSLLCLARCNKGEEGRAGVVTGDMASCHHCRLIIISFISLDKCIYKILIMKSECLWSYKGIYCWLLQSHPQGLHLNGLSQFFSFYLILSNCFRLQTVRRFSTRTHLSHNLSHFTNMCLPHGEPCSIKT